MIINAEELRIGNLVNVFLGVGDNGPEYKNVEVHGIMKAVNRYNFYTINHNGEEYSIEFLNNFEPIILTKEWILKLGFKKFCNDYTKKGIILHTRKRGFIIKKSVPQMNYVHQLQNLYFALTGEELIKKN